MKKSLIALAVAGVVSAPAFAATSNVDVYGIMNIVVEDTNGNNGVAGGSVTPGVVDNVSRIGFKGSEDLGGGMKAVWQIEQGLSATASSTAGVGANTIANRNTFIGLAGDFGTVLMGRHDTPYKLGTASLDIFADTIGDYNLGRTDGVSLINNGHDARSPSAVAYISPTWSGFHFAVAAVMADVAGAGTDKAVDANSLTMVYANGPLFASLSRQDLKGATDNKALKLGVGYSFGDAKVGFVMEHVNNNVAGGDTKAWLVNGVYNMGPIAMKAQYGKNNMGSAANQTAWALGADYNLSKRTAAYVVFANGDDGVNTVASNAGDVSGWNLGIKHSF